MEYPIDPAEEARLATLVDLDILDTATEPEFQAIVQIARITLQAPIVLVSLVDKDRQWFKARVGLDISQTPRCMSFCSYAILQPDMLIVPDARQDERFANNALVTGHPYIRFYAGAPLKAANGIRLGTVCAADTKPRPGLLDAQIVAMERLAVEAVNAMERRMLRLQTAA